MGEIRRDLDLAQKAFAPECDGQLRTQHLERHFALMLEVTSEVDRRHPTATEHPFNGVAVGEGGFETVKCVRHGAATPAGRHF